VAPKRRPLDDMERAVERIRALFPGSDERDEQRDMRQTQPLQSESAEPLDRLRIPG
jgi:hypothetical protein